MLKTALKSLVFAAVAILILTGQSFGSDISLSVKGGYFHYSEPDIGISYSGLVSGVEGDFEKSFSTYSFRFRSEFMSGQLSYDGKLNSHEVIEGSVQISEAGGSAISYDSSLWYSDSAGLVGKSFLKQDFTITPYTGLGFRYLNNPENSDVGYDYTRKVTYIYLPFIIDVHKKVSKHQSWGVTGEIDILLQGSAKADLSDASDDYNNLQFDQSRGGAVKLSGFYKNRFLGLDISVSPFMDLWMVDNSDTDVLTYNGTRVLVQSADGSFGDYCEPANITLTAGLQVKILF